MAFKAGSDTEIISKLLGFKTVPWTDLPFLLFVISLGERGGELSGCAGKSPDHVPGEEGWLLLYMDGLEE